MFRDAFHKKTIEEVKKEKEDKAKIEEALKIASDAACDILSSDKGVHYSNMLNNARDTIIDVMRKHVEPDPVKKAFFYEGCIAKLDVIYNILEGIQRDARKRKQ